MTTRTVTVDKVRIELPDTEATVLENYLATSAKGLSDAQAASVKLSETKDAEIVTLKKLIEAKDAEIDTFKKVVETKDVEIVTLKKAIDDGKLPAVLEIAKRILGAEAKLDGLNMATVKRAVVSKSMGDWAKDKADDVIAVSFDTIAATLGVAKPGSVEQVALDFGAAGFGQPNDAKAKAYADYEKRVTSAWRKPAA